MFYKLIKFSCQFKSHIFNHYENQPEAEFKEFYPQLKFKPRLKYSWFHLKFYSRYKPALNWNWFLADFIRESNSLNSDTVNTNTCILAINCIYLSIYLGSDKNLWGGHSPPPSCSTFVWCTFLGLTKHNRFCILKSSWSCLLISSNKDLLASFIFARNLNNE